LPPPAPSSKTTLQKEAEKKGAASGAPAKDKAVAEKKKEKTVTGWFGR
jgi:hypothetical protein